MRDAGGRIVQVGPGFDERMLQGDGRSNRYTDREAGQFLARNLVGAMATGARWIAIESWNEQHVANDIAHSVEYGRSYISLTGQLVAAWKAFLGSASR